MVSAPKAGDRGFKSLRARQKPLSKELKTWSKFSDRGKMQVGSNNFH